MASGSEAAAGGPSEEAAGVLSSPRRDQEAVVGSLRPDQAEAAAGQVVAGDDEPAAAAEAPAAAAVARPYYECVFCKRGFTTAQALGGHMNIHRRDRAKPTTAPTSSVFVRNLECYSQQSYHHGYEYPVLPTQPGSGSLAMYYRGSTGPAATTTGAVVVAGEAAAASMNPSSSASASPRELSLFGAAGAGAAPRDHDLHLGLGSFHGRVVAGGGEPEETLAERQGGEPPAERDQLDLELRLGRRPRH